MRPLGVHRYILAVIVAAVLAGCAPRQPAGRWEIEPGVQQLVEAGTVLPDHRYYYLGSIAAPDSIIAISNRYTLRTRVWADIDMDEARLNGWLQWWRTEHFYGPGCEFRGGLILTPDGQRAGVWYSRNTINIVYMPEPDVLEVYQPRTIGGGVCGRESDGGLFGGRL